MNKHCIASRFVKINLIIILLALLQISASWLSSGARYLYQPGTPVAVGNFFRPEEGCNWMGIVGQVFRNGEPIDDIIVKLSGSLGTDDILIYAVSGGTPSIGLGGYEINISDHLVNSTNSLFIQLINSSGIPISPSLPVTTYDDCDRNLIIINFVDVPRENDLYLPLVVE